MNLNLEILRKACKIMSARRVCTRGEVQSDLVRVGMWGGSQLQRPGGRAYLRSTLGSRPFNISFRKGKVEGNTLIPNKICRRRRPRFIDDASYAKKKPLNCHRANYREDNGARA
jgi:hypothetical protein